MCSWTAMVNDSWMTGLTFVAHENVHPTQLQLTVPGAQGHPYKQNIEKHLHNNAAHRNSPSACWVASKASSACSVYNT